MNLVGISINHKTSSLELREAVHMNREEILEFIPKLKQQFFSEGFVLSTCNRTEIFGFPFKDIVDAQAIIESLKSFKPVNGIKPNNFNSYFSCGAVKHLFSVSSGIDSMIVGDSQILAQVKEAFDISNDLNFSGTISNRIFDAAIKVGKRAINETTIGEGAVTVSYAAVQVVEKIFANLNKKTALVIGAGETSELAAVNLRDKGIGKIAISNRTISKADTLAAKVNGEVIPFASLKDYLHNFDIIISATSAPNFILMESDFRSVIKKRKGASIVIMDIAVPRDIDPGVRDIDNVFYHDMDSLKIIVDYNMQKRLEQVPVIERFIMEEMVNLFSWYNSLDVVPTIKAMRNFFDEIRTDELEKLKHKISEEDFSKVEEMTKRMVGRILHNPTIKLRQYAETGENINEVTTNSLILKELFKLDNNNSNNGNHNKEKD